MPRIANRSASAIVAENMHRARIAAGLSQAELGTRLGVSFQQVQKYEHGQSRMTIDALAAAAPALQVPLAALLKGVENPAITPRPLARPRLVLEMVQMLDELAPIERDAVHALLSGLTRGAAKARAAA